MSKDVDYYFIYNQTDTIVMAYEIVLTCFSFAF